MKVSNKLTDEELARLIDGNRGRAEMDFGDLSSFETYSVVENALQLMDEAEFADADFSFDVAHFSYEPLAMCGFLGDESDVDADMDDYTDPDDYSDDTTR